MPLLKCGRFATGAAPAAFNFMLGVSFLAKKALNAPLDESAYHDAFNRAINLTHTNPDEANSHKEDCLEGFRYNAFLTRYSLYETANIAASLLGTVAFINGLKAVRKRRYKRAIFYFILSLASFPGDIAIAYYLPKQFTDPSVVAAESEYVGFCCGWNAVAHEDMHISCDLNGDKESYYENLRTDNILIMVLDLLVKLIFYLLIFFCCYRRSEAADRDGIQREQYLLVPQEESVEDGDLLPTNTAISETINEGPEARQSDTDGPSFVSVEVAPRSGRGSPHVETTLGRTRPSSALLSRHTLLGATYKHASTASNTPNQEQELAAREACQANRR